MQTKVLGAMAGAGDTTPFVCQSFASLVIVQLFHILDLKSDVRPKTLIKY